MFWWLPKAADDYSGGFPAGPRVPLARPGRAAARRRGVVVGDGGVAPYPLGEPRPCGGRRRRGRRGRRGRARACSSARSHRPWPPTSAWQERRRGRNGPDLAPLVRIATEKRQPPRIWGKSAGSTRPASANAIHAGPTTSPAAPSPVRVPKGARSGTPPTPRPPRQSRLRHPRPPHHRPRPSPRRRHPRPRRHQHHPRRAQAATPHSPSTRSSGREGSARCRGPVLGALGAHVLELLGDPDARDRAARTISRRRPARSARSSASIVSARWIVSACSWMSNGLTRQRAVAELLVRRRCSRRASRRRRGC